MTPPALTATLALALAALFLPNQQPAARVEYTIRYDRERSPALLSVGVTATGLPRSDRLVARLANWGEWTAAPYEYVRNLRVDGRAVVLDSTGAWRVPPALLGDRRLDITYDLMVQPAGTAEHYAHKLLPARSDHHLFAFARNTLIGLLADTIPLDAGVTVRVESSPGDRVFADWASLSAPTPPASPVPAPDLPFSNGLFAIGRSRGHAIAEVNGTVLEVVQFAGGPDSAAAVAQVARTLLASYAEATGRGPGGRVTIVIDGSHRGGTATPYGLVMSRFNPEVLAHELFHHWLGGHHLVGDESVVWFYEGFTDYLALWHAAATGVISPNRFGERMLEIDANARASALGRIAFADSGIVWRDNDGPNETMAYKGGTLLALMVDARLRQTGRTANALIRHLIDTGPRHFRLTHIREAFAALGLDDLYRESVAGTQMPAIRPVLRDLGFDQIEQPAALTYLGIEARFDGTDPRTPVPAVVTALDSAGPAARAGVLVGDRIVGLQGNRRDDPPELGPGAPSRYRFALNVIPSGARSVTLDLERDGRPLQVEVAPVLTAGGRRFPLRWNPGRGTGFFDTRRR